MVFLNDKMNQINKTYKYLTCCGTSPNGCTASYASFKHASYSGVNCFVSSFCALWYATGNISRKNFFALAAKSFGEPALRLSVEMSLSDVGRRTIRMSSQRVARGCTVLVAWPRYSCVKSVAVLFCDWCERPVRWSMDKDKKIVKQCLSPKVLVKR